MKTLLGVLLLVGAACTGFLVLASSCSSGTKSSEIVRDPGPGKVSELHGPVHVQTLESIRIGGRPVRLPSLSLPSGCDSPSTRCYGFVVTAPDGRTAERVSWWRPARQRSNQFELDSSAYRV